jgi:predicted RNA binding protein YcfA (HicA-like mRNA interferase family)
MERNGRKLLQMLKRDGWELERVKGDHHTFKRADRTELVTIANPRKDLPIGQVRSIYRIAGWKI